MGCDYYIYKILHIELATEHVDTEQTKYTRFQRIEASINRCYFNDDDVDSDSDYKNHDFSSYLEVNYVPKILYTLEDGWKTEYIKNKYIDLIKENGIDMANVIKIIKEEERYFR